MSDTKEQQEPARPVNETAFEEQSNIQDEPSQQDKAIYKQQRAPDQDKLETRVAPRERRIKDPPPQQEEKDESIKIKIQPDLEVEVILISVALNYRDWLELDG